MKKQLFHGKKLTKGICSKIFDNIFFIKIINKKNIAQMKKEFSWYNIVKDTINEITENTSSIENQETQKLWPLKNWNGNVVLTHNSSQKIKNGVINRRLGKTNNYSNRSDSGNYFWGGFVVGKDNSNYNDIVYYCLVPQDDVYDMMANEKNYTNVQEALKNEKYIAYNWPSTEGAVVVRTLLSTPISYISFIPKLRHENEISGLYDSNWKLLRSYMLSYDKKFLTSLLKKLKLTKDIELPDFFDESHNYNYDKVLEFYNKIKNNLQENSNATLDEATPHEKTRNVKDVERFFRNGKSGFSGIQTIVVLTSENPDSQPSSNKLNKKSRHSLLSDIKRGGYAYVPAIGKFGNTERPYAVFNMSVNTAKILCGKYQQTSFVFSALNQDGSVHSEYYEKRDPTIPYNKQMNNYIKKDESDIWKDMSDSDDNFTIIGNKFKYSIPFDIFNTVNKTISENLNRIVNIEKKRGNNTITEEKALKYTIDGVGQSPFMWRKEITKGLL